MKNADMHNYQAGLQHESRGNLTTCLLSFVPIMQCASIRSVTVPTEAPTIPLANQNRPVG
jgi:hypothetical protein